MIEITETRFDVTEIHTQIAGIKTRNEPRIYADLKTVHNKTGKNIFLLCRIRGSNWMATEIPATTPYMGNIDDEFLTNRYYHTYQEAVCTAVGRNKAEFFIQEMEL